MKKIQSLNEKTKKMADKNAEEEKRLGHENVVKKEKENLHLIKDANILNSKKVEK